MDIAKRFGTSEILENEGTWVDMGEGLSVKIARVGNKANLALTKKLAAPHKVALRNDKLPDDIALKLGAQITAETILLCWKGLEENGKPLPYSIENAVRVLIQYKDFRNDIASFANDLAIFQQQDDEAAEKNLLPSSSGSGSGEGVVTSLRA